MKKLLLIAALLFASYGVFADEFDDVVKTLQSNSGAIGCKVRSNKSKRIIYIDFKLPAEVTSASSEELAEFKKEFIKSFRSSSQGKAVVVMKRINASFCINLILTNGKVYRVRIAPDEM